MSSEKAFVVVEMGAGNAHLYNSVPSRFEISGLLRLSIKDGSFAYEIEELEPPFAVKTYTDDPLNTAACHAVFFALADGKCAGQVHIRENWNGMACVDDIRVAEGHRRTGVGRMLMDAAAAWAKMQRFPAVCLETQHNNADACLFYAAYGFKLMGADMAVYDTYPPLKGEIALHWYLPLEY